MLAYVKGKIIRDFMGGVVVLTGNIGYKIYTNKKYSIGSDVALHLYHYIREDQNSLFGFQEVEDLSVFEQLISVSGVGPKLAMQIMSQISSVNITKAITQGNATVFRSVSGVGTKVATKIIVELKSKITKNGIDLAKISLEDPLVDGLVNLGIAKGDAISTIVQIPEHLVETKARLQWALKNLIK